MQTDVTQVPGSPASSRNLLRKELFAIVSEQVGSREDLLKGLAQHHDYQFDLEDRGITFGAGPLFDPDGVTRAGLIIVRAASFEDARAIADSDPFHRSGVRRYRLFRWLLNEGSFTATVRYSTQTVLVG